ncbi:hypothetical protein [Mesorhizobium sp. CN2-181]|uniref:hypothetical protein n=1 Tax=Mesorhizobium yinganensis TaxID=3157707 RepID=UPI0032B72BD3
MSEIVQLERQIEEAKAVVEQRDMMVKLTNNREFKKLIVEGFMKDECSRYTHLSTQPGISLQDRADALAAAQAAGHLKRWINAIIMMGNNAEGELGEAKELLDELRAEAADAAQAESFTYAGTEIEV